MRHLVSKVFTKKQSQELQNKYLDEVMQPIYKDFTDPLIKKLINVAQNRTKLKVKKDSTNSYWVVESRPGGYPWHYDTGNNGQMPWCSLSVSTLLTNPEGFSGGQVYFKNEDGTESIYKKEHYLSALVWSSREDEKTNLHRVQQSKANDNKRVALCMFLEVDKLDT